MTAPAAPRRNEADEAAWLDALCTRMSAVLVEQASILTALREAHERRKATERAPDPPPLSPASTETLQ